MTRSVEYQSRMAGRRAGNSSAAHRRQGCEKSDTERYLENRGGLPALLVDSQCAAECLRKVRFRADERIPADCLVIRDRSTPLRLKILHRAPVAVRGCAPDQPKSHLVVQRRPERRKLFHLVLVDETSCRLRVLFPGFECQGETDVAFLFSKNPEHTTNTQRRRNAPVSSKYKNNAMPHVLIIEDDPDITTILQQDLEDAAYRTTHANSVLQGLTYAIEQAPDLVLLDLTLPDGNGRDVLTRLKCTTGVRVIVLTARDTTQEKVELLDLGASD